MEGTSFLRDGCFGQLGRERIEKSWVGRSGCGGSGFGFGFGFGSWWWWCWSTGREEMEEKGLMGRRRCKWRDSTGWLRMAVGNLIFEHRTAVRNPFMNSSWVS